MVSCQRFTNLQWKNCEVGADSLEHVGAASVEHWPDVADGDESDHRNGDHDSSGRSQGPESDQDDQNDADDQFAIDNGHRNS